MTPKEKAEELVQRYNILQTFIDGFGYEHAKECAVIAVDEIITSVPTQPSDSELERFDAIMFWIEVKQEVEKL